MQTQNVKNKKQQTRGKSVNADVTVKLNGQVKPHTPLTEWGASTVSPKMLLIPRILVMQLTSKLVIAGDASFGDFVSSLDTKKIGSVKEPLEIVPIYMYESWLEFEVVKGQREYRQSFAVTGANDNLAFKETVDGKPIERDRIANLYCLLPKEVAMGGELPYILAFRSTSRIAGRKVATQMYAVNSGAGLSPAAKAFKIMGEKKEGKQGAWIQLDAQVARASTPQEEQAALKWYKTIMAGQTKTVDDEIVSEVKEEKAHEPAY